MSFTQGRSGRSRFAAAAVLLVALVAAMLAQVAIADTASAATPRTTAAAVHRQSATRVTIDHNAATYDVGTVPITGTITGAGRNLGGATVEIWSRPTSATGTWTHIANARSNTAGRYSVNITATTVRYYQARFNGTYSWARSASPVIHLYARKIGTRFAGTTPANTTISYGGGIDIRGTIVDGRGHRVTGQKVQLYGLPAGARTWILEATTTTGATGSYVFSPRHQTYTIVYQVRFPATVKWTASMAPAFRLTVGKLATTVTESVTATNVDYGFGVVVSGHLGDARGTSLAGQRVAIYGSGTTAGWALLGTVTTNSAGNYSFTTAKLTASTTVQARFAGADPRTASTSKNVLITVGAKPAPPVVTPPPVLTPPVTTTPPPVQTSPAPTTPADPAPVTTSPTNPPAAPATWVKDPALASATFDLVNAYRVQSGVGPLTQMASAAAAQTDSCVAKNTTGTFCDPYNLAAGWVSADAVLSGWKASPEHNVAMIDPNWATMSCAAYSLSDGSNAFVGCAFDW